MLLRKIMTSFSWAIISQLGLEETYKREGSKTKPEPFQTKPELQFLQRQ